MNLKATLKLIIPVVLLATSCSIDKLYKMKQSRKVNPYEQIDFNEIVKLYFAKDKTSVGTIEGIYSVSSLITKKGKGMLSATEKEKVVDRKENYSEVAVIQDKNTSGREYLEVSLNKDYVPSYSIRGEFTGMSEGNILVYKHFESRGRIDSYTFTYDKAHDILEGVRTENDGAFTITYKLTYLKLFPKNSL
jgi:hypothetical protein